MVLNEEDIHIVLVLQKSIFNDAVRSLFWTFGNGNLTVLGDINYHFDNIPFSYTKHMLTFFRIPSLKQLITLKLFLNCHFFYFKKINHYGFFLFTVSHFIISLLYQIWSLETNKIQTVCCRLQLVFYGFHILYVWSFNLFPLHIGWRQEIALDNRY